MNQIVICVSDSLSKCLLFRFQTQRKYCITANHETFFLPSISPIHHNSFLSSFSCSFHAIVLTSFFLLFLFFTRPLSLFHCLTLSLSLLLVACFPFYFSPSFMFLSIPRRNMLHLNLKLIHFSSILPFRCQTFTSLSPTISLLAKH